MRRAQTGDERAFDEIVARFGSLVLVVARSITRHRQDAEDVAQEAFLKLFRTLDRCDPDRPLEPWLVKLTLNAARNRVARRPERREDELGAEAVWPADRKSDPSAALRQRELRAALLEAMAGLPQRAREVFLLREVNGLETAWVAEAMGITEVTVRRLASEARLRVTEWLRVHRPELVVDLGRR
ncbi:MAG: sigma-70 family RNA polymerase sigma factor [Acidobacteriota bacterium]